MMFDKLKRRAKKIQKAMIDKDLTAAGIGRTIGCTRSNVQHTIMGRSKSIKVREAISRALEIPYENLWGEDKRRTA